MRVQLSPSAPENRLKNYGGKPQEKTAFLEKPQRENRDLWEKVFP
ncbi:hypothetical protein [Helicobacter suis]|nr:hypothetical protein [Helicobacter suis]